ncbi:MAG: hypothetical protein DDT26_02667 [Dehalococcoidia bacterium]|nr:hypothetical protein [Chloroflexota bacterium]
MSWIGRETDRLLANAKTQWTTLGRTEASAGYNSFVQSPFENGRLEKLSHLERVSHSLCPIAGGGGDGGTGCDVLPEISASLN